MLGTFKSKEPNVSEIEGTIQFAYELTPTDDVLLDAQAYVDLASWRSILWELELLGQTPEKYAGYGYGNLSVRYDDNPQFVITASQTSGEKALYSEHLVRVSHCNLERFWVDAQGSEPPSSESLTHGMVYAADPRIKCVFHVHSQVIWQHRSALKLPQTPADVSYGSQAMIAAVAELMEANQSRPLTFATAGHEDGIFACGRTPRDCGTLLVSWLAKARAMQQLIEANEDKTSDSKEGA